MKKNKCMALLMALVLMLCMMPATVLAGGGTDSPVTVTKATYTAGTNGVKGVCEIWFEIDEAAEGNVVVDVGTALADYLYYRVGYIMPSNQFKITVHITNRSPNTFVYKNNGMTLGTVSAGEEESTGFTGYDGNKIALKNISGIQYTHPAIVALFGNDEKTKDLSQVLDLYTLLKEKGYTGSQALSDYFLDYYKTKYADSTLTWEALLSDSHRNDVIADCSKGGVDNIFSVSTSDFDKAKKSALKDYIYSLGGGSHIQIKWPEEKLAAMSYDIFYQDLLSVVFKDSVDIHKGARDHGVGDYLDKNAEPYISANAYLASIGNNGELASGAEGEFQMTVTLEGQGAGNGYAYYDFDSLFNLTLQFIPATTSISVSKKWNDANNKDGIRPDNVTVQLYANGDKSGEPVTLNYNGGWEYTFNSLPVYSAGKEITYTVQESAVNGYTSTVTGNAADGFVITNSHEPEMNIDVPETGDPSPMMLWAALACLSLCGMAVVLHRVRKEN